MSSASQHHIVVLHGWSYSSATADSWEPLLSELRADGHTVEYLSIPGLDSNTNNSYTFSDYLTWLENSLSSNTTIIIGHSFGGKLALAYAASETTSLRGLVLIAHSGFVDNRLLKRFKRSVFGVLSRLLSPLKAVSIIRKLTYALLRESDYLKATPAQQATLRSVLPISLEQHAARVNIPTLCVWGSRDTYTPLYMAYKTKELIPHAELKVIHGARHAPHVTNATEVHTIIKEFLSEI